MTGLDQSEDPLLGYGQELVPIECPEVPGVRLFCKRATLAERLQYQAGGADEMDIRDILALMLRNEDGSLRFPNRETAGRLDNKLAEKLFLRAMEASKISAAAVEEAEKK